VKVDFSRMATMSFNATHAPQSHLKGYFSLQFGFTTANASGTVSKI